MGSLQEIWQDKQDIHRWLQPVIYSRFENTDRAQLSTSPCWAIAILRERRGYIAINPKFDKLITSLITAVENDGVLDKEVTSYDDVFDAFMLALHFYRLSEYQGSI
jgi:hypothetical protein